MSYEEFKVVIYKLLEIERQKKNQAAMSNMDYLKKPMLINEHYVTNDL